MTAPAPGSASPAAATAAAGEGAAAVWSARADLAQDSLDALFGAPWPQFLHNSHPAGNGDTVVFNYWWLAHAMDARLDAFLRTGDAQWLEAARRVRDNIVERNGGSLFNDYFDDMLWFALALERLHRATSDPQPLAEAIEIWDHVVEHGWNDTLGWSLAWRKQQLYYKNTPANGPLVILSVRLSRLDDSRDFLGIARQAFGWLTDNLVGPDGFVEDGINREQDGRVDAQWRFTYNQGLYVGAAVELAAEGEPGLLDAAARTATTAIAALASGGVFRREGDGGDEGLFKGVYYRYLGELLPVLGTSEAQAEAREALEEFLRESTDALWRTGLTEQDGQAVLRPGNDWSQAAEGWIPYSTMLSAIMAVEQRWRLENRADD